MPLTQKQSSSLMNDIELHGRIKVCAMKYSDTITIQDVAVATHTALVKWAFGCGQQPDKTATDLQPFVVGDPAVQNAEIDENGHSMVSDDALQGAVEATVRKTN